MIEKNIIEDLETLKQLYKDNCKFIDKIINSNSDFKSSTNFAKAREVNQRLKEYIFDCEARATEILLKKEYWCEEMVEALYGNPYNLLNDDNFPIDEDYD